MKPPPFDYLRPGTLQEALGLLATTENAKLLAGGQSLMAMLNMRFVFPDALIDINRIAELSEIAQSEAGLRIGAMVRQRVLERSPLIAAQLPIMAEALKHVGHRQTRNRGTIGGSLCHLDPSAELPTLALLYDAEIEIASSARMRRVAMSEFMSGYMSVALEPDELVTAITFKPWATGHSFAFLEHARRRGDFAIASAAVLLERDGAGRVSRAAIAVGGLSDMPIRLHAAEAAIVGTDAGDDLLATASDSLADVPIATDIHADADFRRHVAQTLVRRALRQAAGRIPAEASS